MSIQELVLADDKCEDTELLLATDADTGAADIPQLPPYFHRRTCDEVGHDVVSLLCEEALQAQTWSPVDSSIADGNVGGGLQLR